MLGKDCLLLDSPTGLWEPTGCAHQANFICETKATSTAVTQPTTSLPTTTTTAKTTTTTSNCPASRLCIDGHYYLLGEDSEGWSDALYKCQENNANLASIHSVRLEKLLEQLYEITATSFWIGGKVSFGNLIWTDGTSVNYTNWIPGAAPTPGTTEGCVTITSTGTSVGWGISDCSSGFPFVCAYPL
uniref:C-type lectin domain-containing protein n=1 Tax=Steinernema glaseri TaxID=37863 RepID=A0A1I7ZQC9_9BILA